MIILEKVFLRILHSSLTATVIVLLVLFLKKIFKDRLSPRFHHILWFLVLIKLLMPFALESNLSIFNLLPNDNINSISFGSLISYQEKNEYLSTTQTDMLINEIRPNLVDTNRERNQENYFLEDNSLRRNKSTLNKKETSLFQKNLRIFSYVWLIGFLSMTVFVLSVALKFKKNTKSFNKITCPNTIDILNNCREKLALNKQIELFCGESFRSPFIFGIFKPKIYLPKHILNEVNNQEISHILLHELSHYKRRDLLCNLLSTLAVMLHWFNPAVWLAMKKMRADIECACDMYVLENLKDDETTYYGRTIIKLSGLISRSQRNRMLYTYFYEGNKQIERRINMISMFKKGSYKLTTIAMVVFIALGCCTLTNAQTSPGETTSLGSLNSVEAGEFILQDPYKNFYNLDRAIDFINFDFKVPANLPLHYEFNNITLDEDIDLVNIYFNKNDNANNFLVSMIISNNDIVKYLKDKHSKINDEVIKPNIEFSERPMKISNMNGICLSVNKNLERDEKNISELQKDNKSEGGLLKVEKLAPSQELDKYFIWQDNNIWYSIHYYNKRSYTNSNFAMDMEIPEADIKTLVSSLKYPKEIQKVEYVSKDDNRFLEIYSDEDLEKAQEILGFIPKFPLNLPGGFVPISSQIFPFFVEENQIEMTAMETVFRLKDENSVQELKLSQTKNTSEYDDIAQKGYIDDKHPVSINTAEESKIKVTPITIDNIKIFAYERNITNPNILSKGITKVQYYIWKQNDIVYEAQFVGDIGNQQEIVKALIKTS